MACASDAECAADGHCSALFPQGSSLLCDGGRALGLTDGSTLKAVDVVTGAVTARGLMGHAVMDTSGALVWREQNEHVLVLVAGAGPGSAACALPDSGDHFARCFRYGVCVVHGIDGHCVWRFDDAPR